MTDSPEFDIHLATATNSEVISLFDPTTVGGHDTRKVSEQGFGGVAAEVVAFVGSAAVLLQTIEWIRVRMHHQCVVDLRDEKQVRIEVQEPRNGLVIVIAPDGSITNVKPEHASALAVTIQSSLGRKP